MRPLTDRQAQVVRTIYRFTLRHGMPPTLRDLMAALAIGSTHGVTAHIAALRRKGWLAPVGESWSVRQPGQRGVNPAARSCTVLAGVHMSHAAGVARAFPAIDYAAPEGMRLLCLLCSPCGAARRNP